MDIEIAAKTIAIVGSLGVLAWFLVIANVHAFVDDPFFAHRGLGSMQIRANLAATATSLAGVLFFFMENTANFGWVLLTIPVFNALGFFAFLRVVEQHDNDPILTGSIYRFLRGTYKKSEPARFANYIVLLNLGAIFIIEVTIGTTIFGYIVPGLPFQLVAATILSFVAFYYVIKGGFTAVTQTDRWQFYLVILGFALAAVCLLVPIEGGSNSARELYSGVVRVLRHPKLGLEFQIAVIFNIVLTNLSIPATQISTWERYCATSREDAIDGFKTGVRRFLMPIWILAIVVAALTLVRSPGPSKAFVGIFDVLVSQGGVAALFVFPLLFAALLSALLSTIDSFMIASMLAVTDLKSVDRFGDAPGDGASMGGDELMEMPATDDESSSSGDEASGRDENRRASLRLQMRNTGLVLVVAAISVTWLVSLSQDVFRTITQLLFATYGMPCLLFPMIWYAGRGRQPDKANLASGYLGLLVGMLILLAGSVHGLLTGVFYGTILGPVIGILVSGVGMLFTARTTR